MVDRQSERGSSLRLPAAGRLGMTRFLELRQAFSLAHSQNHVILVDVRRTDFQSIGFRTERFKSERPVQFFRSDLSGGNRQQDLLQRRILPGISQKSRNQSFSDALSSLLS